MSRKEAIREKMPFSISVTMDTMPPVTGKPPSRIRGTGSRKGLAIPTAHTRGSTIRSR